MMQVALITLCGAMLMVSAATAQPAPSTRLVPGGYWASGVWVVSAAPVTIARPEEDRHAAYGEPLFQQSIRPHTVAILDAELELRTPNRKKSLPDTGFSIPKGEALYEFVIRASRHSNYSGRFTAYCVAKATRADGLASFTPHVCLYDEDKDGAFDHVVTTSGRTVYTDFTDFVVSQSSPLAVPLQYRVEPGSDTLATVGIVAKRRNDSAQLFWAILYKKKWETEKFGVSRPLTVEGDAELAIAPDAVSGWLSDGSPPTTVSYAGLTLTISDVSTGGLNYKVESQISPAVTFLLPYIVQFPVE